MKNFNKILVFALLLVIMPCIIMLGGCSTQSVGIVSISKTATDTSGLIDTYTITYSDGSTSTFTVTNGRNGSDGKDGKDAKSPTVQEIYQSYVEKYGEIDYKDWLAMYLSIDTSDDDVTVIDECLLSVIKLYTEYKVTETQYSFWGNPTSANSKAISGGGAVIIRMDDDYTYAVTDYHVIYNLNANADNGGKIASKIIGYLYGSEGTVKKTEQTDENGYVIYDYGNLALEFEYVAGSIEKDLAVIRIPTNTIKAVNPKVKAAEFADNYVVGETAIAIGNPEGLGISVTKGVVSVDSEYIALQIDDTVRYYRSLRMDTSIYSGSSGGGLFNKEGKLIGITNAGNGQDENVNYAVPLSTVKLCVEDMLRYALDGNDSTNGVYKVTLGFTANIVNSAYIYDQVSSTGIIKETIKASDIQENSIASKIGMQDGDILQSITINGTTYAINRSYEIGDWLISLKIGDVFTFTVTRGTETITYASFNVQATDLVSVA